MTIEQQVQVMNETVAKLTELGMAPSNIPGWLIGFAVGNAKAITGASDAQIIEYVIQQTRATLAEWARVPR